jgi:PadR family transcriptional regulator, regulatory protein PadR
MPTPTDWLQGTLDLWILRKLAFQPMHGWGTAQRIGHVSMNMLQIGQGSLYPALHRLEYKGWIKAEWGNSEHNRRAMFCRLTGSNQLRAERKSRDRRSDAASLVLGRNVEVPS